MRPSRLPKTVCERQAEIAYFEQRKAQTRSRDRIHRAEVAIRLRRQQLALALQLRRVTE